MKELAPPFACAVCGSDWDTPRARANHERGHGWVIPPDIRTHRDRDSSLRLARSATRRTKFVRYANRRARGLSGRLSIRDPFPEGPCSYCGGVADSWDHVVPLSRGGVNAVGNLTPSCWPCNKRKGAYNASRLSRPLTVTLPCAWCGAPVTRLTRDLERPGRQRAYVACSVDHRNRAMWARRRAAA